jgi:hypothetical protein
MLAQIDGAHAAFPQAAQQEILTVYEARPAERTLKEGVVLGAISELVIFAPAAPRTLFHLPIQPS